LFLGDDVDEHLAVDRERHRPPQIGVVEGRLIAVDEQVPVDRTGGPLKRRPSAASAGSTCSIREA
jgi:hypothetical protein